MVVDGVTNYSTVNATEKGTKVVKNGNELDKNAFLQILVAELSNQDPENAQDSTQYVAQLAQFSSLEQMANLSNTMRLAGAAGIIGANVKLNSYDSFGNQCSGIVKSVVKNGDDVTVKVDVTENGSTTTKEFDYSDVTEINYGG